MVNASWNVVAVLELDAGCACLAWLPATGFTGALSWVVQSCSVRSEILQSPNPKE